MIVCINGCIKRDIKTMENNVKLACVYCYGKVMHELLQAKDVFFRFIVDQEPLPVIEVVKPHECTSCREDS